MKRIFLIVSYDGTKYCGWQKQQNGITIEEVLNKAVSDLTGEDIEVIGASRTDSGVHAMGNVAVFDTEMRMPAEKYSYAINQRLPDDIRVQYSCEVGDNWHPRKQNCFKTYEYTILNAKINNPLMRFYTYFCYLDLDVDKMREATSYFIGEHDFKSFCTATPQKKINTCRIIESIDIEQEEDLITIRICGNGFLYNMVRIIVGTLIKVATGVYPPEHIKEIIASRNRMEAGPKAPAEGLALLGIEYETDPELSVKKHENPEE